MTDLAFNFDMNDIVISGGDFDVVTSSGQQNGGLLFNKSATSILAPQYGVGFEEFYPNLPQWEFGNTQAEGEQQMIADGALVARVKINAASGNVPTDVEIYVKYRDE